MRVHVASGSTAITHTLEHIILQSGHEPAPLPNAELILVDLVHPPQILPTLTPCIFIGGQAPHAESLSTPLAPQHLIRLLRNYSRNQPLLLGNGWCLDLTARNVTHPSTSTIALTEKECALLAALIGSHPEPLARDTLLADVWGVKHDIDTHTLETHIYRLRSKLSGQNPPPCDIVTEGGAYKLMVE